MTERRVGIADPQTEDDRRCANCVHFAPNPNVGFQTRRNSSLGSPVPSRCTRYPVWLAVGEDEWCGEWSAGNPLEVSEAIVGLTMIEEATR